MKAKKITNKFIINLLFWGKLHPFHLAMLFFWGFNSSHFAWSEDLPDRFALQADWHNCSWDEIKENRLCGGSYHEPVLNLKNNQSDLIVEADHTKFISKGLSSFTGNVILTKKNQQLQADKLWLKQDSTGKINEIEVEGKVKLTEPGLRIIGNNLKINVNDNYKIIKDVNYRIYAKHATGDADQIEIHQDKILQMARSTYTTCSPNNHTWKLVAQKVQIDKAVGRGEAHHARLYLKQIPIFYFPYISFPTNKERHSGFLLPSIYNSSKHGFTIGIPYYFNLAPNYDYTFAPAYLSKRGLKLNNQFRYLYKNNLGILKFNALYKDKVYGNFVPNLNDSSSTAEQRYQNLKNHKLRYSLLYKNITTITPNTNLYLNYNKVSDDNYLQDFGQDFRPIAFTDVYKNDVARSSHLNLMYINGFDLEELLDSSSLNLERSVRMEHVNRFGVLNFIITKYQTLYPLIDLAIENPYQRFPQINFNSNYIKLSHYAYFKYMASYTNFTLANFKNLPNARIGKRVHFRPSLEYRIGKNYYFKPRIQLDFLNYHDLKYSTTNVNQQFKHKSRMIPIFDVKSGIYFDKIIKQWQHTIEPNIYYLYVPKISQDQYPMFDSKFMGDSYRQLFLANTYSGEDRIPESKQITLGIKHSLRQPDGEEKMLFAIASARFLNNNGMTKKWSPIGILLNYNVQANISIEIDILMEKINKVRSSVFNSQYRIAQDKIINLGYNYDRSNLTNNLSKVANQQINVSTFWAARDNLNLLGRIDYDFKRKRISYGLLGVGFNSCCLAAHVAISRNFIANSFIHKNNYNTKLLAQIIFKGFSDVGSLEDNHLTKLIPGYMVSRKF